MDPNDNRELISIVIPAYNEEDNVEAAYQSVKTVFQDDLKDYNFEIIFTDNHSTDSTFEKLKGIASADDRVKVARFSRNYGFNRSVLTGYSLANGDAAIQIDCDLQDPPSLFPEFIRLWKEGHDVVVGIRKVRSEPAWILALRKLFYRLLSRISQDNLVVDGGDFRLVDRHIIKSLQTVYDPAPYVRGLISAYSKNQTGFPYLREERKHGMSKFPLVRLVSMAVDGIVSHSTIPLRIASLLGITIAILTLLGAAAYFLGKIFFGVQWPSGFATDVILELVNISLNALFLGIIGEYLSRIHLQLKRMPNTVIQEKINL